MFVSWPRARSSIWLAVAGLIALSLSNCRCAELQRPNAWKFQGPDVGTSDVIASIDTGAWEPENVLPNLECRNALNDRTSLIVDSEGTTWIGFHRFTGERCQTSTLVVAHKAPGGEWVEEEIQRHDEIFGLSAVDPGRPLVVYPDSDAGVFKAAHREGGGTWREHVFDLGADEVQTGDGFDVTQDGRSFWVTFAGEDAPRVRLFEYDTTRRTPSWESRSGLRAEDPAAAMARGLRADPQRGVYLVHRDGDRDRRFGIARYDSGMDAWVERTYVGQSQAEARVHSLAIAEGERLCMSSRLRGNLLVTCGDMEDLSISRKLFSDERIPASYPSSITVGRNGTLYVAYHPADNSELRVAERTPQGEWSTRTVFDDPAYGVSTAIDPAGELVLGFYTCDLGGTCSLKVLREEPARR